jgi:hypothetical protein
VGVVRQEDGSPQILPSDIEAAQTQYGLTPPEAERFLTSTDRSPAAAETIKAERKVYRQTYGAVTRREDVV